MRFGIAVVATAVIAVLLQSLVVRHQLGATAAELPNDADELAALLDGALAKALLVALAVLGPLSLGLSMRSLQRLVGPLRRFRGYLASLRAGEKTGPCTIRRGDDLEELCDLLNLATAPLRTGAAPGASAGAPARVEVVEVGELHGRTRLFPEPRIQLRFCVVFFLTAAITALVDVVVLHRLLEDIAWRLPNDGAAFQRVLPRLLPASFSMTLALLVPVSLLVGASATLRIVGPLGRFRGFLEDVARGARPQPCRIRSTDELQELCALLNEVTEPLRNPQPVHREPSATRAA